MLLAFQVYRGMLRYVGVADLLTLAKAAVCSSLVLGVLLPIVFRDEGFPRSVLAIDWLLFTALLVGSRASFAALTDTFARIQSQRVPHLLVIGAGDLGELVLRSLIRSHRTPYQPVGFLDPDPGKRNRAIHGVPVLGTLDDLERVVSQRDVDLVVLALPHLKKGAVDEARERCAALGLPCYQAAAFLERHFGGEPPPDALGSPGNSQPTPVG
jgi:FlaA1/EpsC-like NDP-sugar epimerase